jgi:hypothetical protein
MCREPCAGTRVLADGIASELPRFAYIERTVLLAEQRVAEIGEQDTLEGCK